MTSKRHTTPYVVVLMIAALMAAVALSLAHAQEESPAWDGPPHSGEFRGEFFPYHRGPGFGLRGLGRMAEALDLTPEQHDEVREILEQARPQMRELRGAMRDNMKLLFELTPTDPEYSNTVAAASQEAGALVTRMIELGAQTRVEVHSVLTPEQQARIPALKEEMRGRMRGRFHERHHERSQEGTGGGSRN